RTVGPQPPQRRARRSAVGLEVEVAIEGGDAGWRRVARSGVDIPHLHDRPVVLELPQLESGRAVIGLEIKRSRHDIGLSRWRPRAPPRERTALRARVRSAAGRLQVVSSWEVGYRW